METEAVMHRTYILIQQSQMIIVSMKYRGQQTSRPLHLIRNLLQRYDGQDMCSKICRVRTYHGIQGVKNLQRIPSRRRGVDLKVGELCDG